MQPNLALHRCEELLGVEADTALEYDFHVLHVVDAGTRVAANYDEVRTLAHGDAADPVCLSQVLRAIQRGHLDGFEGGEPRVDEQLELALVGIAGHHAAVARGIRAGEEQSAGPVE